MRVTTLKRFILKFFIKMKKFNSFNSVIATALVNNILPNSQEFDRNAVKDLITEIVGKDLVDVARVALYIQGKLDMPEVSYKARINEHDCTLIRVNMIHGTVEYSYETEDVRFFKTEADAKNYFLNGYSSNVDSSTNEDKIYCVKGTHTQYRTSSISIDSWNNHAVDGADNDIDKK